jgi:gas vesicle protein
MSQQTSKGDINGESLMWGFVCGLVVGALAALFASPRSGSENRQQIGETGQQLRDKIEATVIPVDSVATSMAEGKAAARRRRAELGLD